MEISKNSNNRILSGNRFEWVDVCKGIGMLLVLVGHFFTATRPTFYTFHMPLFFFLSGFVLKTSNSLKASIMKYGKKCLLPYAITSAIIIVILILTSVIKHTFSVMTVSDAFIRCFYGIAGDHEKVEYLNIPMVGSLWFLQALLWGGVISDTLSRFSKSYILSYTLLICLCGVSYFSSLCIWLPTNIQSGVFCAIFIFLGHHLRAIYDQLKQKNSKLFTRSLSRNIVCVCGLLLGMLSLFITNLVYDSTYPIYGLLLFPLNGIDFVFCIFGCVFVVCASVFICRTTITNKVLSNIGKNSLYILCVHSVDRFYLKSAWGIVGNNIFVTLFRIILTLVVSCVIGQIIEKRKNMEKIQKEG